MLTAVKLSFEEQIFALATIRTFNINKAVDLFSKHRGIAGAAMRGALYDLNRTHYLTDNGVVRVNDAGVLQFLKLSFPEQPVTLTTEYYDSVSYDEQCALTLAVTVLGATVKFTSIRNHMLANRKEEEKPAAKKTFGVRL